MIPLFLPVVMFLLGQVQEKKIKKVCNVNLDSSKINPSSSNGSSILTSSKRIPNGGCEVKPANCLSTDFSFPPGGIASLHLPTVIVFNYSKRVWF